MKPEINSENKAKFFALYWGKKVGCVGHVNGSPWISEVDTEFYESLDSIEYLELSPLSEISEEDLRVITKDWLMVKGVNRDSKIAFINKNIDFFAERLRFLGIACDWIGISVEEQVEAGWVKFENDK